MDYFAWLPADAIGVILSYVPREMSLVLYSIKYFRDILRNVNSTHLVQVVEYAIANNYESLRDWYYPLAESQKIISCYQAAQAGCENVIHEFMHKREDGSYDAQSIIEISVKYGHLNILKYILKHNTIKDDTLRDLFSIAMKYNHNDICTYLIQYNEWILSDVYISRKAAFYGNLEFLEKYCKEYTPARYAWVSQAANNLCNIISCALRGKHAHIIEWLVTHRLHIIINGDDCELLCIFWDAYKYGHIAFLNDFYKKYKSKIDNDFRARLSKVPTDQIWQNFYENNQINMMRLQHDFDILSAIESYWSTLSSETKKENPRKFHIMKIKLIIGPAPAYDLSTSAAKNNEIDILELLLTHNIPIYASCYYWAAHWGNIEMLNLLRAHKCPIDEYVLVYAAENNQISALDWLYEHHPHIVNSEALRTMRDCVKDDQYAVLQWLEDHGFILC